MTHKTYGVAPVAVEVVVVFPRDESTLRQLGCLERTGVAPGNWLPVLCAGYSASTRGGGRIEFVESKNVTEIIVFLFKIRHVILLYFNYYKRKEIC